MTPQAATALPRWAAVLVVGAHPDDESFGMGAVLAAFADAGSRIALISFTHGEASTLQGMVGNLAQQPLHQLATHVREMAEAVGADRLLVFDEGGIAGHPDHCMATQAALAAADRTALPVLAWAIPLEVASRLNTEFDTAYVGRAPDELDIDLAVDRTRQLRAISAHQSQSTANPVLWRRLELFGDREYLRWLRPDARRSVEQ